VLADLPIWAVLAAAPDRDAVSPVIRDIHEGGVRP
jgi:hypothetical protein